VRDSRTIILHHQDGPFAARPSLQQLHKRKKLGAASVFLVTARRTSKLRNGWVSQQVVDDSVVSAAQPHTVFVSKDGVRVYDCVRDRRVGGAGWLDSDLCNYGDSRSALEASRSVRARTGRTWVHRRSRFPLPWQKSYNLFVLMISLAAADPEEFLLPAVSGSRLSSTTLCMFYYLLCPEANLRRGEQAQDTNP
jgi:hypothetical protein